MERCRITATCLILPENEKLRQREVVGSVGNVDGNVLLEIFQKQIAQSDCWP